ncbi:pyridoxamine 5'-phosphate oxidase family protein [Brevibacillus sp. B_LB10_24]|uniref:pyridoxamine 5'-phosphate oxidase family protein n=1 Tax=Brevibacillus sp. B_LB10_24 TaxID=3380645 RepID=UPI0038B710FB
MKGSAGERALQQKYGTQRRAESFYDNQMIDYLNPEMKQFISEQELVFISTADRQGNCDTSIRTGNPGFVRVIDERTLIYPEFRGNGVMASLGNITENPHIGLLFVDFVKYGIGLHVNGGAAVIENDQLQQTLSLPDELMESIQRDESRFVERWVTIRVDEAYIHCSKHLPLMKKLDKEIHWGTDDETLKGGDFFKVKANRREDKLK